MADTRNFRSSYLEKVGIKGVEEKKSLEILLKEQPLDVLKLSHFILRFPIPTSFRLFLWKILLGKNENHILPAYQEVHEFANEQRLVQYNDMLDALRVIGRVSNQSPMSELHLRMYLMSQGVLPLDESKLFQDKDNQVFLSMSSSVAEISDDPIEIFWITSTFYALQDKFRSSWSIMAERVEYYIKKEDTGGELHAHLISKKAFSVIPFTNWFRTCYSGVLPENCLERIWDKVIGGSCQLLQFVAVSILLTLKRPLMSMTNSEDIVKYLSKIPDDFGDRTVINALDLWQKYGSLLLPTVHKPDSPAILDKKS